MMTAAQRRRRDRMRKAVELRAKGFSLRAIAAHLEVAPSTVLADLRLFDPDGGNRTPPVRDRPPESNNVIVLRRDTR
jgi:transposase